MDALLHIFDWLVDNKIVGIPVASAIVLALAGLGWFLKQRRQPPTYSASATTGSVQQMNVTRTRSTGDVNLTQRQE